MVWSDNQRPELASHRQRHSGQNHHTERHHHWQEKHAALGERRMDKLQQEAHCGGEMNHAQMMAEWEAQQSAKMDINGDSAAAIRALGTWRTILGVFP